MTQITRRQTTGLLIAASLAPNAAFAQLNRDDIPPIQFPELADFLELTLNKRIASGCNGKFTVPEFDVPGQRATIEMTATICLEWPPGLRLRKVAGSGNDPRQALEALVTASFEAYDMPWPGCIS